VEAKTDGQTWRG